MDGLIVLSNHFCPFYTSTAVESVAQWAVRNWPCWKWGFAGFFVWLGFSLLLVLAGFLVVGFFFFSLSLDYFSFCHKSETEQDLYTHTTAHMVFGPHVITPVCQQAPPVDTLAASVFSDWPLSFPVALIFKACFCLGFYVMPRSEMNLKSFQGGVFHQGHLNSFFVALQRVVCWQGGDESRQTAVRRTDLRVRSSLSKWGCFHGRKWT